MSGWVPRTLLFVLSSHLFLYWGILIVVSSLLLLAVWILSRRQLTLDATILWGFIVNPFVHDYDLIQLLPLLDASRLQAAAVLLSLPGWLVILFAYGNDTAWYAFSLIAPGLLWLVLADK
ncbi:MAG: hypothetical protein ACREBU_08050, partial [Nitrososphaera sp.]